MRINHNISSMITQGALYQVDQQMATSLQRLSTGLRINSAADDAAGLGISENLRTQVNGTSQAMQNAQAGISAIAIAEGSANEISNVLQRMRELAVESANDTLTPTDRSYSNDEYQQLISEIDRISQVTNYNGMALLSSAGTDASTRFGIGGTGGGEGSALWVDANSVYGQDSITVSIDTLSTDFLGLNTAGATAADLGATTLTSQTDSTDAMLILDASISSVNAMRANMGAYVNRLNDAIDNLTTSNTNQQAAESDIRDVDFAHETATFTRNQILTQSATAMLAQANALPQSVLTLLGGQTG